MPLLFTRPLRPGLSARAADFRALAGPKRVHHHYRLVVCAVVRSTLHFNPYYQVIRVCAEESLALWPVCVLKNLTKSFNKVTAVNSINLEIRDKEFMVLVGPSGCGKTTALRMIAGLEESTERRDPHRRAGGQRCLPQRPRHRDGVPELRALSAHDRLRQHEFRPAAEAHADRRRLAVQLQAHVHQSRRSTGGSRRPPRCSGLKPLLQRKPKELSGGQRQRVALGRAIVREPKVFLMDEPLSNLDAKLRVQTRAELIKLHRRLGITTVYVTHDQVEAMTMGDRIAVMSNGIIQQCDKPLDPLQSSRPTCSSPGSSARPAMNFVPVTIVQQGDELVVDAGSFKVTLPPAQAERVRDYVGKAVHSASARKTSTTRDRRPGRSPTPGNTITVDVDVIEPLGSDVEMYLKAGDISLIAMIDSASPPKSATVSTSSSTWTRPTCSTRRPSRRCTDVAITDRRVKAARRSEMTVAPPKQPATLAEFERLPEAPPYYEFENGEIIPMPSPTPDHQDIVREVSTEAFRFARTNQLGRVFMEVDVYLPDGRVYVPDISFLATEHLDYLSPIDRKIHGVPDLCVEVISQNENRDRVTKFRVYHRNGVFWYWLIDPITFVIEEYRFTTEGYVRSASVDAGEVFSPGVFPGLELNLADLLGVTLSGMEEAQATVTPPQTPQEPFAVQEMPVAQEQS